MEITNCKARLCSGGKISIEGIDYWDTYYPVVAWSTVRLMIFMALLMYWCMQSIYFVLASPQASILAYIYTSYPRVIRVFRIPDLQHLPDAFIKLCLLLKNLCGIKDDGMTWFGLLKNILVYRVWEQFTIDTCLLTKSGISLIVYVNGFILILPSKTNIQNEIN